MLTQHTLESEQPPVESSRSEAQANRAASMARATGRTLAHLIPGPVTTIVLTGLFIEVLLLTRLWIQLHVRAVSGLQSNVMDVSGWLVTPFRSFDGSIPLKQTGILEFATLAAIEAYLVAGLALIFVTLAGRVIIRDIAAMLDHSHRAKANAGSSR